ncbi:hypothetical protein RHG42_20330 [Clostridioides difficile]|nr:hypothetical protein [Clostridioides difficile]
MKEYKIEIEETIFLKHKVIVEKEYKIEIEETIFLKHKVIVEVLE